MDNTAKKYKTCNKRKLNLKCGRLCVIVDFLYASRSLLNLIICKTKSEKNGSSLEESSL